MTVPLNTNLVLKGGILLGLAYGSPRQTTDIDLTAAFAADRDIGHRIGELLNTAFPRAAASLGYADLVVRTQSASRRPKHNFVQAEFPALKLKIAYVRPRHERAEGAKRRNSLKRDRSRYLIHEPLNHLQLLQLTGGQELFAYGLVELVAEKYRALLQQVPRNRYRRQDVYDLDVLIPDILADGIAPRDILEALREKCYARDVDPDRQSLDNTAVKNRAGRDWNTMELGARRLAGVRRLLRTCGRLLSIPAVGRRIG